jgi:hypothetical protein
MTAIPILSLVVAALAVFVGPLISWRIAKRQLRANLEVSNKQIVGPMRQAWINSLRDLLAEVTSSALHYHVAGFEERTDEEYQHLTHLEYRIKLMLNASENDHRELEEALGRMVGMLNIGDSRTMEHDREFAARHDAVVGLARKVLKREWDRIKEPILPL